MRVFVISLLVVVALSVSVARADRTTYENTKTQFATQLDQPPVIDGVIDPSAAEWGRASIWEITVDANLADGIRGGATGDGAVNPPADNDDLSFRIFVGYDTNNLYVAVRVKDSVIMEDDAAADSANGNTWMDDSVEVFIDGDNSNFESRDTTGSNPAVVGTGGQYVITVNNAYREAEAGNPGYGESAAWFAKTSRTDTGYDAEFRISLSKIGNPKPGDIIGFTVGVNDDDDGGGGERQVVWVGRPHTEATYGNLIIQGKSYTAPKTAAPTIDGTINANEYPGAAEIKVNVYNAIYDLPSGDDMWEPTDHGFSAWVVHDSEAIYVAVDVTDDILVNDTAEAGSEDKSTWEDDSVEIFFDAQHDHVGQWNPQREPYEGQYVFTANGAHRDNEANNPAFGAAGDWFAATSQTAGRYRIEFKVKKSALLNPQDGATLGFHIAVNDDDGSLPAPKTQFGWSGIAHNETYYGHLTLAAGGTGGGSLVIRGVRLVGGNIEFSVTTPNAAGNHVVQQRSGSITAAQWTAVSGVTWSSGAGGTLTAVFPRPSATPTFYRVAIP